MINLACNLLLFYLEELKTDDAEYKRMKELINRLLAKARQHNGIIPGLLGVHFGMSPTE